jgi:cytochrome b
MHTTQHSDAQARQVPVWDPLVRIFHWSLVALFLLTYVTGEEESGLHVWAGYAVLTLVALRTLWGFVGTRHARFRDFARGPAGVIAYAKDLLLLRPKRYLGHNPLGGAMIMVMLATLIATGASGLALQQTREGGGAIASAAAAAYAAAPAPISWARADDDDRHEKERGEEWLKELHEFLAHFMILLVLAHIAGVALGSAMHRENLVRAMFTGRKHA